MSDTLGDQRKRYPDLDRLLRWCLDSMSCPFDEGLRKLDEADAYDELVKSRDEIERLRARVKDQEDEIQHLISDPTHASLRLRIEELERQQDIHCGVIQNLVCEDSHVRITIDQIDELIRCAWTLRGLAEDGLPKTQTPAILDMVFDQLISMLGIKRCEECGGRGKYEHVIDYNLPAKTRTCPYCNGHGWVKEVP